MKTGTRAARAATSIGDDHRNHTYSTTPSNEDYEDDICMDHDDPTMDGPLSPPSLSPTMLSFLSSSPTDVLLSPAAATTTITAVAASPKFPADHSYPFPPPPQYPLPYPTSTTHPWPIFPMSQKAQRTQNPIRALLDPILRTSSSATLPQSQTNHHHHHHHGPPQQLISLALGDPIAVTVDAAATPTAPSTTITPPRRLLRPCPHAIRAVLTTLQSDDTSAAASYTNAIGTLAARRAIAQYHSHPDYKYDPEQDVIIASGCSGALELVLTSLLDPSPPTSRLCHSTIDDDQQHQQQHRHPSILLVPSPGFPLYRVIAESHGATVVSYPLLPHRHWEVDLVQLQSILEQHRHKFYDPTAGRTMVTTPIRGMVINNPSNPTGAVYSTTHLQQIVRLCQHYCIPIIADEIYGDMVFPNEDDNNNNSSYNLHASPPPPPPAFVSLARIAAAMGRVVPVVTASGIGKQFLLPGWRIGWICFQDKYVFGAWFRNEFFTPRIFPLVFL